MTLESLKNIIPSGFEILTTEFSDKQFYLIQKSGKNVVAKILIDIDQNSDINDIKKYQEKFIAKDYFNSQGYLQWNYYLIFVRDDISNSVRKTIEQDESYTRKFVFNDDELKNYLQYVKTSSNEEDDIVGRWKNLLIKANLQEVFSDEKYTKAIDRFVNGETKKLEELKPIDSEPNKSEDFILDEVTNLSLKDNYRPFPEIRDFDFKKVNLICGPNGVGKTSLMEAVELMITGKNARNEKSNTADGSIEAQYEVDLDIKNDIFKYETAKYKARDLYWYNKTYSAYKTDTLFESFNRYNFYNSDSAYHLSNNSDNDLNKYLSATYNNKIAVLRSFFKWCIEKFELNIYNPFEKVRARAVVVKKDTITQQEFKKLLEIISPENGHTTTGIKQVKARNRYKPYLKDAIELALHTGGRREEVVDLTWNMITESNNEPVFITVRNLKVERQKGEGFNENVAPKIIPVTKSLKKLLYRMGYENKKGKEEFIISPDRCNTSTYALMDNLSKGFSHFYKQLGTGRNLQLKSLRKTYLTYLSAALSGDAKSLSSHTSDEVLQKHYIDEKIVSKAVKELDIFSS